MKEYEVFLEEAEEGGYVITCPALPGCISEGETREEALANIKDAIQGYLETLRRHSDPIPAPAHTAVCPHTRANCLANGRTSLYTRAIGRFRQRGPHQGQSMCRLHLPMKRLHDISTSMRGFATA